MYVVAALDAEVALDAAAAVDTAAADVVRYQHTRSGCVGVLYASGRAGPLG